MFQQEAYATIRPPVDAQNSAIPQNGKRPVRDVAKPPCKISRRSAKPRLTNPLPYNILKICQVRPPGYTFGATGLSWNRHSFLNIRLAGHMHLSQICLQLLQCKTTRGWSNCHALEDPTVGRSC